MLKTENKLVSIICVTKNAEKHLNKCIQSIINQSHKQIQLIIIDGASTDGTIDTIKKWDKYIDFWMSEPDTGVYDAMNKALPHIKGSWVYFIGADDFLFPDFSDFIIELQNEDTIYYANVLFKNKKVKGLVSGYEALKNGLFHQSIIYPSVIFKTHKFNLNYKISADHHLNILLNKDYYFKYCNYTIAMFNHTGISSKGTDSSLLDIMPSLAWRYFNIWIFLRYMLRFFKTSFKNL